MSRQYKRINPDGSRNIWCMQCTEYIGAVSAMVSINTAICSVCQAFNEGIDLTEEQVKELRATRLNGAVVSHAVAFPAQAEDPMAKLDGVNEEEYKENRLGYFFKALVRQVIRPGIEAFKVTVLESKQVAKEKKRRRVFEQPIDPD